MNESQRVSIGIVTYNSRDHIDRCLQSVMQQTYSNIDIIILDNASADGTADWLAEHWPQCQMVRSEVDLGFGRAHNRLIALTDGRYYMPLNPDVVLTATYVAVMVETIQSAADIGWAASKLLFCDPNGTPTSTVYTVGHAVFRDGYAVNIGNGESDRGQFEQSREVFGANGAAPLYRRDMLQELFRQSGDYYDETIFLYGEDVELDWRARLLGWRCLYTQRAVGYHVHGGSGGSTKWNIRKEITANRYYTVFKDGFLFDVLTYNLPAFIAHSVYMLFTEPRRGMATIVSVVSRTGTILQRRRWMSHNRKLKRRELMKWFMWSDKQRGQQPVHYLQRFADARFGSGQASNSNSDSRN